MTLVLHRSGRATRSRSRRSPAPSHGTLGAINQGRSKVTYTPTAGYSGPDSFTYRATDGTATSPAATVSITVVAPPNTSPSCQAVAKTVVTAARDRAAARLHGSGRRRADATRRSRARRTARWARSTRHQESPTRRTRAPRPDSFTYKARTAPQSSAGDGHADGQGGADRVARRRPCERGGGQHAEFTDRGRPRRRHDRRVRVQGRRRVVQTGASKTLSRRFDAVGDHTVVVQATDDDDQTATASKTVTITKKPDGGGGDRRWRRRHRRRRRRRRGRQSRADGPRTTVAAHAEAQGRARQGPRARAPPAASPARCRSSSSSTRRPRRSSSSARRRP